MALKYSIGRRILALNAQLAQRSLSMGVNTKWSQNDRLSCRYLSILTENVPALGESITEGAIAEWVKTVGEAVAVDDVVAIVETDKVTVDIKSPFEGVLIEQMAAVDDTIVVGAPLYKIDTDGTPSTTSTSKPAAAPVPALVSSEVEAPSSASAPSHGARTPLIKFLGKRSLLSAPITSTAAKSSVSPLPFPVDIATSTLLKEGDGVDFTTMQGGAWFGRPPMSEMEIVAIESGVSPELEKLFPSKPKKK